MSTDGEQPKVNLIHQNPNNPNLVTDLATAQEMANATQKGYLAAEKIEAEAVEKDQLKLLGDKLIEGVSGPGSFYTGQREKDRMSQTHEVLKSRMEFIKSRFNEEKIINGGKPDMDIIQEIVTNDDRPLNVMDITYIVGGNGAELNQLISADLVGVTKAFGVIPQEVPSGRGSLPRGRENDYFSKLLKVGGEVTTKEIDYKFGADNPIKVTEFTKPTSIEGVKLIIGLRSDSINLPEGETSWDSNNNGDARSITTKIELTPQFIAKSIGVSPETK